MNMSGNTVKGRPLIGCTQAVKLFLYLLGAVRQPNRAILS